MEKTLAETFSELLDGFTSISSAVNYAAIYNEDGIAISSTGNDESYEMKLGAYCCTANGISSKAIEQLDKGEPMTNLIVGTKGFIVVTELPSKMILTVSTTERTQIGAIIKHSLDANQLLKERIS